VQTGQIVNLTPVEAATVSNDTDFIAVTPRARSQRELKIKGSTTLTNDDSGKRVIADISADAIITLPSQPKPYCYFEVYFGESADATKQIAFDLMGQFRDDGTYLLSGATINAAGTNYQAGDSLTVAGGTQSTGPATITVSSVGANGTITGVSVGGAGGYSSRPADPASVTGGHGTGAQFNLTWQQPAPTLSGTQDSIGLYWGGSSWKLVL
jgi:hypothetical protein